MNDDNNERRLPPRLPEKFVPNKVRNGSWREETPPRAPLRAIRIKGDALRAAVRNGSQLDWTDIHE